MSPSYATSKSPSDFWMGQNTKKSIKFIRVTFNKTRKHHMWNWVLNKSFLFMLYSADCPWASILEFNTSLPKKGGSIHLTSTYSSLLLKWSIKVCWYPPFRIFSVLEDPHESHTSKKKTMPRGSTTTTGLLPLFFCPFSSRRWVSSLLRWMKKWWNFQEATIFRGGEPTKTTRAGIQTLDGV